MAFTHLCEGVNLGLTLLTPPTPHRERGDGVCRDGSISLLRSGPEVRPEPLLPEAEWDVKQKESGSVTSEALRGAKASRGCQVALGRAPLTPLVPDQLTQAVSSPRCPGLVGPVWSGSGGARVPSLHRGGRDLLPLRHTHRLPSGVLRERCGVSYSLLGKVSLCSCSRARVPSTPWPHITPPWPLHTAGLRSAWHGPLFWIPLQSLVLLLRLDRATSEEPFGKIAGSLS